MTKEQPGMEQKQWANLLESESSLEVQTLVSDLSEKTIRSILTLCLYLSRVVQRQNQELKYLKHVQEFIVYSDLPRSLLLLCAMLLSFHPFVLYSL